MGLVDVYESGQHGDLKSSYSMNVSRKELPDTGRSIGKDLGSRGFLE